MYMMYIEIMAKQTYTLTEARQNFFELIKLADAQQPATIKNAQNGAIYQLVKTETKPKKDIVEIAKRMSKRKLDIGNVEDVTKILQSTHEIKLWTLSTSTQTSTYI